MFVEKKVEVAKKPRRKAKARKVAAGLSAHKGAAKHAKVTARKHSVLKA